MADQRQDRVGTRGLLQLRHAVGGGRRNRMLGIDQQRGERGSGSWPVELTERKRHLLAYASVRVGGERLQM